MEESTANGLKQERRRRKRITQIRRGILSIFVIWFVFSVGICTSLLIKVHTLEEKMNYLLDKSLIGGMVIRIGDRVVDSSISTKLNELQKELLKVQL